jgi:hypothetical protein
VIDLQLTGRAEELVEAAELLIDGRVLECGIEDVDRLVWTWHVLAILPMDVTAPRWLPKQEEGMRADAVCRRWPVVGRDGSYTMPGS